MSAVNVSELEKFPDFADNIVRDWSMASRSPDKWNNVFTVLFGARRAIAAVGFYELWDELTTLSDLAAYHHMRSDS